MASLAVLRVAEIERTNSTFFVPIVDVVEVGNVLHALAGLSGDHAFGLALRRLVVGEATGAGDCSESGCFVSR